MSKIKNIYAEALELLEGYGYSEEALADLQEDDGIIIYPLCKTPSDLAKAVLCKESPIKLVIFNIPRYAECINLDKLGKEILKDHDVINGENFTVLIND